jgi:hypothetical protein
MPQEVEYRLESISVFAFFAKKRLVLFKLQNKKGFTMRKNQQQLLEFAKKKAETSTSFVEELADLLNVSTDSAYRRMRGDTDLSFEEAILVVNKYGISLEQVVSSKSYSFEYLSFNSVSDFVKYLENINQELIAIRKADGEVIYQASELPFFYNLGSDYFLAFKFYTWQKYQKYIQNNYVFDMAKICNNQDFIYFKDLCNKIYRNYQRINCTEIWTDDTLNSTIKQLKYYKDLGVFADASQYSMIIEELNQFRFAEQSMYCWHKRDGGKLQTVPK